MRSILCTLLLFLSACADPSPSISGPVSGNTVVGDKDPSGVDEQKPVE
jgi:hypothetical protein